MTSPIHDSPVVLPEENAPSKRDDKERRLTISGVIAWIVALIFFAPIFWIFLAALKTDNTILAYPPKFLLPASPVLSIGKPMRASLRCSADSMARAMDLPPASASMVTYANSALPPAFPARCACRRWRRPSVSPA